MRNKRRMIVPVLGWALSIGVGLTSIYGFAPRTPNCAFSMSNGSCPTGCTAVPLNEGEEVCVTVAGGCCNGVCQTYGCKGDDSSCSMTQFIRWQNNDTAWHAVTCPAGSNGWSNDCNGGIT